MGNQARRAVLYARKSKTVGDEQSKSVTDQLADCRRYAESRGWMVVAELADDGKSGVTIPWAKRPEFARAVDMFQAGEADTFVTLWTSRLSRDDEDRAGLPRMLAALDVEWHAVDDGGLIETETYSGWMMDGFRRLIDVGESKRKSEIFKATHRRRLEAGMPSSGQNRYGYLKSDDKKFAPDPVTGPILRSAYIRYNKGAGLQAICAWLNTEGHRTRRGSTWGIQTLRRTLDSGFGAGLLITGKGNNVTYSPGVHEGVIDADEWQAYLDARDKRKTLAPKQRIASWHLAGLATCGVCGGRIIRNGKNILCSAYHNGRSCSGVWMRTAWIEQRVAIWIGAHVADFPERDVEDAGAENVVTELEVRLAGVREALARLGVQRATGEMDADAFTGAQAILTTQRDDAMRALVAAREELARLRPVTRDEWSRLEVGDITTSEWNQLLGRVLRRAEVHADRLVIVPVVGETVEIFRG